MKEFKFIFVLIAISFSLFGHVSGQKKWSIKPSYGTVRGTEKGDRNIIRDYPAVSHFRLEASYNVYDNLFLGCYFGDSKLYKSILITNDNTFALSSTNALYYGINADYRLLSLLTNKTNVRFDVYPILRIGLVSEFWKEPILGTSEANYKKLINTSFELGSGLGSLYKITPKVGIFGEYTFGKFYNKSNSRFHVGFLFNF